MAVENNRKKESSSIHLNGHVVSGWMTDRNGNPINMVELWQELLVASGGSPIIAEVSMKRLNKKATTAVPNEVVYSYVDGSMIIDWSIYATTLCNIIVTYHDFAEETILIESNEIYSENVIDVRKIQVVESGITYTFNGIKREV